MSENIYSVGRLELGAVVQEPRIVGECVSPHVEVGVLDGNQLYYLHGKVYYIRNCGRIYGMPLAIVENLKDAYESPLSEETLSMLFDKAGGKELLQAAIRRLILDEASGQFREAKWCHIRISKQA